MFYPIFIIEVQEASLHTNRYDVRSFSQALLSIIPHLRRTASDLSPEGATAAVMTWESSQVHFYLCSIFFTIDTERSLTQ